MAAESMPLSSKTRPKMTSEHSATTLPDSPRLLTRVRDKIHLKHYSIRTEHAYVDWIRRFTRFHGMRLLVKDMNFARREILIRDRKGYKGRVTVLPRAIESSLREQLEHARKVHRHDLAAGFGAVWLPYALARKYPQADREWAWQYVFPAAGRSRDTGTGVVRRH